jgi:hypothetical protein
MESSPDGLGKPTKRNDVSTDLKRLKVRVRQRLARADLPRHSFE